MSNSNDTIEIVFLDEVFGDGVAYHAWADEQKAAGVDVKVTAVHAKDEAHAIQGVATATVVVASFFPVTEAILEAAPKCKLVHAQGTGYNHVDVQAANKRGIPVTHAPGWCTNEVAEHAVAQLLAIARGFPLVHESVSKGEWDRSIGNSLHEVKGSTLGLIGCGRTARAVAQKVASLGIRVIAYDPYVQAKDHPLGVPAVTLDELAAQSDYLSVHTPLTPDTRHLLGAEFLSKVKRGALLVNTARGGVLDEDALCDAVASGQIARAALDVFENEPLAADSRVRTTPGILLSPHLAGTSAEAFARGQAIAISEITKILAGKPLDYRVPTSTIDNPHRAPDAKSDGKEVAVSHGSKLQLPDNPTMRDIFDACTEYKMFNVAAGMIEVPPPATLLSQMGKTSEQTDIHMYRARFGDPVYLEGVKNLLTVRYGMKDVSKDCLMACAGVTGIIVSTLLMVRKRGGTRIGLLEPFYTYHYKQVDAVFGGVSSPTLLPYQAETFKPDLDAIEQTLCSTGLDLIIICNPGNPVGRLWTREELERLVAMTKTYGCMLLIDEIYVDFVWDHDFWSPIYDEVHDHVIVARGFSKNICVGSWRLAYAITGPATVKGLMAEHDRLFISTSVLQQTVGRYLQDHIDDCMDHLNMVRDTVKSNYARLTSAFEKAFGWKTLPTTGSLYAWIRHTCSSDREALEAVLAKGVGVCPGAIFYRDDIRESGYIRIQLGFDEEKAAAIEKAILSE